jgi:hypothetical protein
MGVPPREIVADNRDPNPSFPNASGILKKISVPLARLAGAGQVGDDADHALDD